MRNFMNKEKESINELKELGEEVLDPRELLYETRGKRLFIGGSILISAVFLVAFALTAFRSVTAISMGEEGLVQLSSMPVAATSIKKTTISIPSGTVKANPFLPYRDLDKNGRVSDVPAYNLIEPPEVIDGNSDAARVMDTIVSGILYDKYSPSAILNIEGNDYLVKKGDIVNNYKVLNIAQDSVTVKLGENTYKAGIGEILTEGTLNHNNVSNLDKKFGGDK